MSVSYSQWPTKLSVCGKMGAIIMNSIVTTLLTPAISYYGLPLDISPHSRRALILWLGERRASDHIRCHPGRTGKFSCSRKRSHAPQYCLQICQLPFNACKRSILILDHSSPVVKCQTIGAASFALVSLGPRRS
jgi:hypothetical protein